MYFPNIDLFYSNHYSGRSDPSVLKVIFLLTALDPPDWGRTLDLSRRAKDLGIRVVVMARGEDMVSEDNFRKLSSGRLAWFGQEREHLATIHDLMDKGLLCNALIPSKEVRPVVRSIS